MCKHHRKISWKRELDLLIAAKYKLKLSDIDLDKNRASELSLCKSFLVDISADIPQVLFPEVACTKVEFLIGEMWYQLKTALPVLDSPIVIGEYFENCVPGVICGSPTFDIRVQKLQEGTQEVYKYIPLMYNHNRMSSCGTVPSENVLWRTPKGFKAIDFFATFQETDATSLLAIQVTTQCGNRADKILNSITGVSVHLESKYTNIIFVLINPNWPEFDLNYDLCKSATSGPADKRFAKYSYGQPSSNGSYLALMSQLQVMIGGTGR